MAHVLIESTRSAFRDFIPLESLLTFTEEDSARNWARTLREIGATDQSTEFIYVAETGAGEVVGLAMGGPERTGHPLYAGEVRVLVVLPAYQRQGVGRRLVETVAGRLAQQGMASLLIRVVTPNAAARRFYEALGGQLVPDVHEQVDEDGTVLEQIAYGWADIGSLAGRAADGGEHKRI
jgi:ribosomal protein S18 acetylase RimI-like enzyme